MRLFILLLFTCSLFSSFAQQTITGTIVNEKEETLFYAHIGLLNAGKGTVSIPFWMKPMLAAFGIKFHNDYNKYLEVDYSKQGDKRYFNSEETSDSFDANWGELNNMIEEKKVNDFITQEQY